MSRTLIRGGSLVSSTETRQADLLIDGETIAEVRKALPAPDAEVVDAGGKLVPPGGIDPHTHFDLPMFDTVSSDDHYTGHKAAAFGGTTTVMDFVPQPESGPLRAGLDEWHAKADPKAAGDFSFHMNVTRQGPVVLAEEDSLTAAG